MKPREKYKNGQQCCDPSEELRVARCQRISELQGWRARLEYELGLELPEINAQKRTMERGNKQERLGEIEVLLSSKECPNHKCPFWISCIESCKRIQCECLFTISDLTTLTNTHQGSYCSTIFCRDCTRQLWGSLTCKCLPPDHRKMVMTELTGVGVYLTVDELNREKATLITELIDNGVKKPVSGSFNTPDELDTSNLTLKVPRGQRERSPLLNPSPATRRPGKLFPFRRV